MLFAAASCEGGVEPPDEGKMEIQLSGGVGCIVRITAVKLSIVSVDFY